ncbi:hypothetical protein KFK09_004975 [Dendrobium nobile]|uniref:Uncharacterized protein n=1 Tax=Dendrobium nobile TaxID=94219 RepID=A0A8T3BUF1_DENNO|nr:hypothetical protein KFK09_004975 [Dendrobium nobile]
MLAGREGFDGQGDSDLEDSAAKGDERPGEVRGSGRAERVKPLLRPPFSRSLTLSSFALGTDRYGGSRSLSFFFSRTHAQSRSPPSLPMPLP